MMSLPAQPTLVDELYRSILPRLQVEDVYDGVDFRWRNGRYWRAACPIHDGEDPNFSVDTETLSWTCFSRCGHGSVVTYLNGGESARGSRFVEIVRELAQLAGVQLRSSSLTPQQAARLEAEQRRHDLLEAYAAAAAAELTSSDGAIRYLAGRGLPEDAAELTDMGLGLHPSDSRLAGIGPRGELKQAGLDEPTWRNRITLVWRDRHRRIATISARAIRPVDPKYLYLRGARRPKFFGLDALPRGRATRDVVVVEGALDALLLRSLGVDAVVALGGSGVGDSHLAELAEIGAKRALLMLDADDAGLHGSQSFIKAARSEAHRIQVHAVPWHAYLGEKDPGELHVLHGRDATLAALDERLPGAVFLASVELTGITPDMSPSDRRDVLDTLARVVEEAPPEDRLCDVEDIVRLAIEPLGYPERAIRERLGALLEDSGSPRAAPRGPQPVFPKTSVGNGGQVDLESQMPSIVADVLDALGRPISLGILTHILRGSRGPRITALIAEFEPLHVGVLSGHDFRSAADLVESCARASRSFTFEVILDAERGFERKLIGLSPGERTRVSDATWRRGRKWLPTEDGDLRNGWTSGRSLAALSRRHCRTETGIAARLVHLGLVRDRDEARQRGGPPTSEFRARHIDRAAYSA